MKFVDYTPEPANTLEGTVKNKDYYASLFMELVKEGYDEFLYRGLEPKNLSKKLKEILPRIKEITSVKEWFESKDVEFFYEAVKAAGEKDVSLASYVKGFNYEELLGYYCYAYYNDLEKGVERLQYSLEKDPRKVDFLFRREALELLKTLIAQEEKEIELE